MLHSLSKFSFRMKCYVLQAAYNALYSLVTSNKGFIHQTKVAHSTTKFVLKDLARRYSVSTGMNKLMVYLNCYYKYFMAKNFIVP